MADKKVNVAVRRIDRERERPRFDAFLAHGARVLKGRQRLIGGKRPTMVGRLSCERTSSPDTGQIGAMFMALNPISDAKRQERGERGMRPSHGIAFGAGVFAALSAQQMSTELAWGAIAMAGLAVWTAVWDA